MGLYYGLFSIFFTFIFPKILTDKICFGNGKQWVKTKIGYGIIFFIHMVIFGVPCILIGWSMGFISRSTTIDKIIFLFTLEKDGGSFSQQDFIYEDGLIIHPYYIRGEATEETLDRIIDTYLLTYGWYDLEGLTFTPVADEYWKMSIGNKVMGYVIVDKGFLVNTINFRWDEEKFEKRRREDGLSPEAEERLTESFEKYLEEKYK